MHFLIRLLAILLVLLPIYGTWFSKDFAAFQPFHQHIFLNGIKLDHHPPGSRHLVEHGDSVDSDGVVNVPDQDAIGSGLFLLFLSAVMILIPDGRDGFQSVFTAHYKRLNGIYPQPLERPPRK